MKSPNELDDFLRQKEAEFDLPFQEAYWKQAEAMLDAQRRNRFAAFWNMRNVGMALLIVALGGTAAWYAATNPTTHQPNQPTVTHTPKPTPFFESKSNAATSTNQVVSSAAVVNTNSNNTESNATGNTTNSTSIASRANAGSNNSHQAVQTSQTNFNRNNTTLTSATSQQNPINASSSSMTTDMDTRAEFAAMKSRPVAGFVFRLAEPIPVFENMTPSDPALMRFYGLYTHDLGSTARKFREFKYAAQYPQMSWAVSGGVNVFNSFKVNADSPSFISTNPYIGVKFGVQWNPVWSVNIQPTLVQRGGVHMTDTLVGTFSNIVTTHRHLYYLQLPVSVAAQLNKRNNVSFGAGPAVLLATGESVRQSEPNNSTSYGLTGDNRFRRMDYFVTAGYQYRLNKKIGLQGSVRCGLTDVTKNPSFGQSIAHRNIQTSIGINYQFYSEKLGH
jgi:hypothetical protein